MCPNSRLYFALVLFQDSIVLVAVRKLTLSVRFMVMCVQLVVTVPTAPQYPYPAQLVPS